MPATDVSATLDKAIELVFSGKLFENMDDVRNFRTNFGKFLDQLKMIPDQYDDRVKAIVEKMPADEVPTDVLNLFFRVPRGWNEKYGGKTATTSGEKPVISLEL